MRLVQKLLIFAVPAIAPAACPDEPGPARGPWIRMAPLPTARHGLVSAAVGGGTISGWRTIVSLIGVNEAFGAR